MRGILMIATATAMTATAAPIVDQGKAKGVIAVTADAPAPEHYAAQELQKYFKAMSGVEVPIERKADKPKAPFVAVGRGAAEALLGKELIAAGVTDEIQVVATGGGIFVVGSNPRSTLYAAYALLERLGCAFLMPGENGEVIPRKETIDLPDLKLSEKAALSRRGLRSEIRHVPTPVMSSLAPILDWAAKRRFNTFAWDGSQGFFAKLKDEKETLLTEVNRRGLKLVLDGHAFSDFIPTGLFKEHPEYFLWKPNAFFEQQKIPLSPNNRVALAKWQRCMSNKDLPGVMAGNMLPLIEEMPMACPVGIWQGDWGWNTWCECDACREFNGPQNHQKNSATRMYMRFVDQVARHLAKKCPDRQFEALAYAATEDPEPVADLEFCPNLSWISYAGDWSYRHALDAHPEKSQRNATQWGRIQGWTKKFKHVALYEYYPADDLWMNPYGQYAFEEMRAMAKAGLEGSDHHVYPSGWGRMGVYYYLVSRAAWNPNESMESALDDWCHASFGSAHAAMKQYYLFLETEFRKSNRDGGWRGAGDPEFLTSELTGACRKMLDEALSRQDSDPACQARLNMVHFGFRYVSEKLAAHRTKDPAEKAAVEKKLQDLLAEMARNKMDPRQIKAFYEK